MAPRTCNSQALAHGHGQTDCLIPLVRKRKGTKGRTDTKIIWGVDVIKYLFLFSATNEDNSSMKNKEN